MTTAAADHASKPKKSTARKSAIDTWDEAELSKLIEQLWSLRSSMLEYELTLEPWLKRVAATYRPSARNLVHYLALRKSDRRPLQEALARIGASSLGRAESHVLANLDKVLGILHRLTGQPWQAHSEDEPVGIHTSRKLIERHTDELLGTPATGRGVRIMVTLPSEAASDFALVNRLVESGMDIARINCAHDGPVEWQAMADHVHRAAKDAGRQIQILMDLGGPKLRTGTIAPGVSVIKIRPERDELGRMLDVARIGLRPAGSDVTLPGAPTAIGVDPDWLARLEEGDRLDLTDARDAERTLVVVQRAADGVIAECDQTAYLIPETRLKRRCKGDGPRSSTLSDLPCREGTVTLERGGLMYLTRDGKDAGDLTRTHLRPPSVTCTLPEVFDQVCIGESIWFDDGRIGGVIRHTSHDALEVEITHAREGGEKLASDKGINLPDSKLHLPALTEKDVEDLADVAKMADLVGLSFVHDARDVDSLRKRLSELGKPDLGIVLKIETQRGFENLPELLFSAMAGKAGVMIARGDLAVECGYERLAEVQEEILWAAEAAHMPVIWATQVLETLAKTGLPSRAEITDAAMGERAECVMLNKGPHITDAMRTLDDILRRMQTHQTKKRPLLRALRAWSSPPKPLKAPKSAA